MATAYLLPSAESDLASIALYVAQDNQTAAFRLVDLTEEKCQLLADSPGMGRPRPDVAKDMVPDLRSFPVGSYGIYYQPVDDGVEVIRIVHFARDIRSVFS
jgi:toxin ParE1/3/4